VTSKEACLLLALLVPVVTVLAQALQFAFEEQILIPFVSYHMVSY